MSTPESDAPSHERATVCTVNDCGQVDPCWGLDAAIEYDAVAGKGLRFHRLTKLDADGGTMFNGRHFVSVRSGDFKRRGIVINYCPFCGTDIGSHMKEPEPV